MLPIQPSYVVWKDIDTSKRMVKHDRLYKCINVREAAGPLSLNRRVLL
jgi:hypothetical protein